MFARVTSFEVDTIRIDMDSALKRFEEQLLPPMQQQEGYGGVLVMTTPEGKGMIVSLWADEQAASRGLESGYYDEQVARFITLLKQPPGRDHYEVMFRDLR
jgi:hypothetical protein